MMQTRVPECINTSCHVITTNVTARPRESGKFLPESCGRALHLSRIRYVQQFTISRARIRFRTLQKSADCRQGLSQQNLEVGGRGERRAPWAHMNSTLAGTAEELVAGRRYNRGTRSGEQCALGPVLSYGGADPCGKRAAGGMRVEPSAPTPPRGISPPTASGLRPLAWVPASPATVGPSVS